MEGEKKFRKPKSNADERRRAILIEGIEEGCIVGEIGSGRLYKVLRILNDGWCLVNNCDDEGNIKRRATSMNPTKFKKANVRYFHPEQTIDLKPIEN